MEKRKTDTRKCGVWDTHISHQMETSVNDGTVNGEGNGAGGQS